MKTISYWLLKTLLRRLAAGVRQRIDTPEERRAAAEQLWDANRERGVGYIEKLLAKGNQALDKIDGEDA